MSNEKCEYISFDIPNHSRELEDVPECLEKERKGFVTPSSNVSPQYSNSSDSFDGSAASPTSASDTADSSTTTTPSSNNSPQDLNSSDSFDGSAASPTSASDTADSSTTTTTPSSNNSPQDSNSSDSFDGSAASPTSASDTADSSTTTTTPSSNNSPQDSNPDLSTCNEPEETFLHFGRKMTWEQIENLSRNPMQREQFEISAKIYNEMKQSPSSTFFFFDSKRRKQCRKVTIPGVDDESIRLYEPIEVHLRCQNLFEDILVIEHFRDLMLVNWLFEVRGLSQFPPLLFGNTDLSLADFICILRLTFPVTKLQHFLNCHTFAEVMKLVMSIASTTDAKISYIVQDSDSLAKDGRFASLFTDKTLENDPGLKELVDLYKFLVEEFQKYAVPISI